MLMSPTRHFSQFHIFASLSVFVAWAILHANRRIYMQSRRVIIDEFILATIRTYFIWGLVPDVLNIFLNVKICNCKWVDTADGF